jgi:subtilase family serine protease
MALGLSRHGISISRAKQVVRYTKYLNQSIGMMSSVIIITVIGFTVVAVRVYLETKKD